MKKVFYLLPFLFLFFLGCGAETDERIKALETENQELRQLDEKKNQMIDELASTLNGIQDTLNLIQQMIDVENANIKLLEKSNELGASVNNSQRENIFSSLQKISLNLNAKKKNLASLNSKLRESNLKISGLEKLIIKYEEMIITSEKQISSLKERVGVLEEENTRLTAENVELSKSNKELGETVEKTKTELSTVKRTAHTLYFKIDDEDKLIAEGYITKSGGLLGIGKTTILSPNISESKFSESIDVRAANTIVINKRIKNIDKIVPSRDQSSYKLREEGEKTILEIIDRDLFLRASKYLIIVLD